MRDQRRVVMKAIWVAVAALIVTVRPFWGRSTWPPESGRHVTCRGSIVVGRLGSSQGFTNFGIPALAPIPP